VPHTRHIWLCSVSRHSSPLRRDRTPLRNSLRYSRGRRHEKVVAPSIRSCGKTPGPVAGTQCRRHGGFLMNAAFLMVASAFAAGSDVQQIGWGENAPAIIQAGCSSCGAPAASSCDSCNSCGNSKVGILDKLKARLGSHKCKAPSCDSCAAPAPTCCAPAPTCGSCCPTPPNLLDKLKGRFAKKSSCCAAPACDSCGSASTGCATPGPAVVVPAMPPVTPKEMPKVKEAAPKAGALAPAPAVIPTPVALPALPVVPSSGLKLSGSNSPY